MALNLDAVAGGFPGGKRGLAVAGVGGTAAVAYVMSKRGKSSSSSSSPASSSGSPPASNTDGAQGTPFQVAGTYPNTYATDVASAVGDLDTQYQARLDTFTKQLGSTDTALASMQSTQQKQLDSLAKATATATANSAAATKAAAAAKKQSDALAKAAAAKKKKPVVKVPAKKKPAIHHTPVRK